METRGGSIRNNLFPVLVEGKPSSRLPRKALGVLGGSAHDRLLTKPVKERVISESRECPRRHYKVRGERSRPKTALLVHKYVIRLMLFWTVAHTYVSATCRGRVTEAPRDPQTHRMVLGIFSESVCDRLFRLPV